MSNPPRRTLPWPREPPEDLAPGDTPFEVPESNYLLDLHGSPQAAGRHRKDSRPLATTQIPPVLIVPLLAR